MRRIARRLDGHVFPVGFWRHLAFANEVVEHSVEERGILGVEAQFIPPMLEVRAPLAQRGLKVTGDPNTVDYHSRSQIHFG
jgi:hypothetical protein